MKEIKILKKKELLNDYKFWCFHGEPYLVMVLYDRKNKTIGKPNQHSKSGLQACIYDLNWNLRPEIISGSHANDKPLIIPKPKCFDEMIKVCKILIIYPICLELI